MLLFLFSFTTTIFYLTPVAASLNDDGDSDNFFGLSPQDYYDITDYRGGEIPFSFSDQFDEQTTIDNDHDTQLPTTDRYGKTPTGYLSKNYSDNINFIAAGDWNCNKETKKTIKKMTKLEPELVLGLGDYTSENISPQCWFDISKPIDDKIKIVIGNHDLDFQSSYDQLLDHYNLREPYYSFDFYNIHFLAISSEHPFEKGSKQYEFIKNDLEKSLQDPSILWRIAFLHKPMYTSANFDRKDSENLKNTFHQLFEKYQIDLVLSGHTQYYQRSLPLLYNNNNSTSPIVIDQNNNNNNDSTNNQGIIFVTAGTAGDKLHNIDYFHAYYAIQEGKFGFLNFELKNNGHTLLGTFHDTDDRDILDGFMISKDNSGKKTYSEQEEEKEEKSNELDDDKYYFASTK
ncbi:MAG TPA: metallophosphoesterase [Nitrososphaeraceae archaeon]|nr:metallophosphoesterase [Nitrososphaeraceae archaeon]